MPIQVIINQAGPLPITATFEPVIDEPMYLEVNGSVSSQNPNIPANVMVGIGIEIDGKAVGAAQIFSSQNQIHRALYPHTFGFSLALVSTNSPWALPAQRRDPIRMTFTPLSFTGKDRYISLHST
jgi:hypothetical protein